MKMADSAAWMNWAPPPGQAARLTGFIVTRQLWARPAVDMKAALQAQVDGLSDPPYPFRKPAVIDAGPDAVMLGIVNVHFTDAAAVDGSLAWAWQIARQAGLGNQEFEITPVWTYRLTP